MTEIENPKINKRAINLFTIFDHLFLLRPILLIPVWSFLLIGYYHSLTVQKFPQKVGVFPSVPHFLPSKEILLTLIFYSALMGSIYILNQIYDLETDRLNKKLFLLVDGYVKPSAAKAEFFILAVLSLIASFFLFPFSFFLFICLSLLLGILYSLPPFKFKSRPILDLLSNALGYGGVAFMIGWLSLSKFSWGGLISSIPYIFAVGGVYAQTTLPDIEGDRLSKNITTGVWLGFKKTAFLAMALIGLSFFFSLLLEDKLCLLASGLSFPLFVLAFLRQNLKMVMISYQVGGIILVLAICFIFPYFLLLLILTFLALKWYYKLRLNMNYPSLADRG
ncbi:MAG: UbiA family prenyltransferase [Candidatus Edwardsbacteria bacterium]